jgi:hypothetical protein
MQGDRRGAGRALPGLIAAALVAAGCGGGTKTDPEAIASMLKDSANATAKGDGDKACSYLTADAQRQVVFQLASAGGPGTTTCSQLVGRAQFFLSPLDKDRIKDVEATDIQVSGTSASATLRGKVSPDAGQPIVVRVNLAKDAGGWKISGFGQAAGLPGG